MSSGLNELYQQLILDHNKSPRNFRKIEKATHHAEGYNPLCGDHFTVFLEMDGDVITDVSFQGSGCAISKASASMMTTAVKGTKKRKPKSCLRSFGRWSHGTFTKKLTTLKNSDALARLPAWQSSRRELNAQVLRGTRCILR